MTPPTPRPLEVPPQLTVDPDDFAAPDWQAPFDVDDYLDGVPANATVRGFFFVGFIQHAGQEGMRLVERGPYYAFKSYPTEEFISFVMQLVDEVYSELPLRQGLRKAGELGHIILEETPVGGPIFSGFGQDILRMLQMIPLIRDYCIAPGEITVSSAGPRAALIDCRNIHIMLEHYFIGVVETMVTQRGLTPDVRIALDTPYDGRYLVQW